MLPRLIRIGSAVKVPVCARTDVTYVIAISDVPIKGIPE
jgi:hypothetical protein